MTPGLSNDFGGGEEKRRVKIIDVIEKKEKKNPATGHKTGFKMCFIFLCFCHIKPST